MTGEELIKIKKSNVLIISIYIKQVKQVLGSMSSLAQMFPFLRYKYGLNAVKYNVNASFLYLTYDKHDKYFIYD